MKTLHIMSLASCAAIALCSARAADAQAEDSTAGGAAAEEQAQASGKRQVTIAGENFEIAIPYEAGHQLNEAEASVLNQTYLENIRNNVAGKIKAAKEQAEKDGKPFSLDTPIGGEGEDAAKTLRQVCSEYAAAYEFGVRAIRSSEPADPVEREARAIAREALNAKLKANKVQRKNVPDEAYEQALADLAKRENVMAEARRRVEARSSIGLEELGIALAPAGQSESGDASGSATSGETSVEEPAAATA